MKLIRLTILLAIAISAQTFAQSGVFVGGSAYYNRGFSINELKGSGFTNVIVWTIHIHQNGDLDYNGEFVICKDGEYVGDEIYPNFKNDIKLLKTQPTSIERIEIGLSAWGSATYDNVKTLIETQGSGESSILYKNFKALKEAIPEFDAINNDDEGTYDLNSTVEFSVMLYDLGFKQTAAPYTKQTFWRNLVDSVNTVRPGAFDLMYLQCYDGGAGNDPCQWQEAFDTIPVYGGLWGAQSTGGKKKSPADIKTEMSGWHSTCNLEGGFLWLYDEWKNTDLVEVLAESVNEAFGINPNISDGPFPATNPSPTDNNRSVAMDATLGWNSDALSESHLLYFGPTFPPAFVANQTATTYNPGALNENQKYYWRIDEIYADDTITGQDWYFKTVLLPDAVENPVPADGATNIETDVTLSFDPVETATVYRIFVDTKTPPGNRKQIYTTEYKPKDLQANTKYYWQVESGNVDGAVLSEIWQFTTGDASAVNDYSDDKAVLIYPNPGNDLVQINEDINVERITIKNILGQAVIDISENTNSINVSSLKKGAYIMIVNNSHSSIFHKQ